ncbi:hypothetical protein DENSPDRAFT_254887 [Dentipellis sp. KUC8613]|nr:hypothetical protein DENSPDRAFT_254887 [Dentipellis sp. KUC8613]
MDIAASWRNGTSVAKEEDWRSYAGACSENLMPSRWPSNVRKLRRVVGCTHRRQRLPRISAFSATRPFLPPPPFLSLLFFASPSPSSPPSLQSPACVLRTSQPRYLVNRRLDHRVLFSTPPTRQLPLALRLLSIFPAPQSFVSCSRLMKSY